MEIAGNRPRAKGGSAHWNVIVTMLQRYIIDVKNLCHWLWVGLYTLDLDMTYRIASVVIVVDPSQIGDFKEGKREKVER